VQTDCIYVYTGVSYNLRYRHRTAHATVAVIYVRDDEDTRESGCEPQSKLQPMLLLYIHARRRGHAREIHTYIYIGYGVGFDCPAFWLRGDPFVFLSIYSWATRCSQAGFKPIPQGPRIECIASLSRLFRMGTCGPVPRGRSPSLGLGDLGNRAQTVTRVSPILTRAPNKVRGWSAQPASEEGWRVDRQSPGSSRPLGPC